MAELINPDETHSPVYLRRDDPFEAALIPIADRHNDYARSVAEQLRKAGLRVMVDDRSERMNAKIRDAQNQKIPYMLVVGDQEVELGMVSLRRRSGENSGSILLEDFIQEARLEGAQGN